MFFSAQMSLIRCMSEQGNLQARPQLAESSRGTGTIFTARPAFLQFFSKEIAMCVVSKVAIQSTFFSSVRPEKGMENRDIAPAR